MYVAVARREWRNYFPPTNRESANPLEWRDLFVLVCKIIVCEKNMHYTYLPIFHSHVHCTEERDENNKNKNKIVVGE
jgi:hypothetical protein